MFIDIDGLKINYIDEERKKCFAPPRMGRKHTNHDADF